MYNLYFYNDGDEQEHYGTFPTRSAALQKIAEVQDEFGVQGFESERFDIVPN